MKKSEFYNKLKPYFSWEHLDSLDDYGFCTAMTLHEGESKNDRQLAVEGYAIAMKAIFDAFKTDAPNRTICELLGHEIHDEQISCHGFDFDKLKKDIHLLEKTTSLC